MGAYPVSPETQAPLLYDIMDLKPPIKWGGGGGHFYSVMFSVCCRPEGGGVAGRGNPEERVQV